MVDPSVLVSVRKGDNAAFKQLYQACIGYVYSITKRYVANESDQPDVIQEIFARVFLSIGTFDPAKGDFKAWLRRLTINQCMQHYRQGKSPRVHVSLEVVSNHTSGADEQFSHLTKEEIAVYLQKMPGSVFNVRLHIADSVSRLGSESQPHDIQSISRMTMFDEQAYYIFGEGFR